MYKEVYSFNTTHRRKALEEMKKTKMKDFRLVSLNSMLISKVHPKGIQGNLAGPSPKGGIVGGVI